MKVNPDVPPHFQITPCLSVEYLKGPRLGLECTFACPVYYFSLEDEVSPKRESFAEMPLAPGFDFECPFVLLKDGRKKSNPVIAAIIRDFCR